MARCNVCRRDDLQWYRSYNRTAKNRLMNPDGSEHICFPEPGPDIVECGHCGVQVYRYTGGKKLDMDGGPHACKQAQAAVTPLQAKPAPVKPAARQPARRRPIEVSA
jgi:hypothetical protein